MQQIYLPFTLAQPVIHISLFSFTPMYIYIYTLYLTLTSLLYSFTIHSTFFQLYTPFIPLFTHTSFHLHYTILHTIHLSNTFNLHPSFSPLIFIHSPSALFHWHTIQSIYSHLSFRHILTTHI